jgi:hypothetical protein
VAYLGSWKIDDYVNIPAHTHKFSTGAAFDATSITYRVYEDETNVEIVADQAMTKFDAETGFYLNRCQLTAAAGFEKGKTYTVLLKATVDGVAGTASHTFQVEAEVDSNAVSDKTGYALSGTQTFNVTGDITGNLSGSVGSVTAPVTAGTVSDKTGYALSVAGIAAIWDALLTGITTVGSIGKLIKDYLDAAITSRLATAGYTAPPSTGDIDTALSGTHGAGSWEGGGAAPTADQNATALLAKAVDGTATVQTVLKRTNAAVRGNVDRDDNTYTAYLEDDATVAFEIDYPDSNTRRHD